MNCEKANEVMMLALYGEAGAEATAELEQHLAACATCREASEASRAALEEFRGEPAPRPSRETITRILEAAEPRPSWAGMFRHWRLALAPALALAMIAVAFTFWPRHDREISPAKDLAGAASATNAVADLEASWSANLETVSEKIRLARAQAGFDTSVDSRIAGLQDLLRQSRSDSTNF